MNSIRTSIWTRNCIQKPLAFCLLLLIVLYENKEHKSIRTKNVMSNGVEQCAYLNCVHSPRCTTQNKTCCAAILKSLLLFVDDFFNRHNLSYVLMCGTLLGAVRNSTIIPWTHDVDIGFFNKTYVFTKEIRAELYRHGYHLFEALGVTRLCVQREAVDDLHHKPLSTLLDLNTYVDLYYATKQPNPSQRSNISSYAIEASGSLQSVISFSKHVTIDGQRFPTVDNIEEHLVHFYGLDYMRDVISKTQ